MGSGSGSSTLSSSKVSPHCRKMKAVTVQLTARLRASTAIQVCRASVVPRSGSCWLMHRVPCAVTKAVRSKDRMRPLSPSRRRPQGRGGDGERRGAVGIHHLQLEGRNQASKQVQATEKPLEQAC